MKRPTIVLAISGGIDSMVLLHKSYVRAEAMKREGVTDIALIPTYIVAHFDHGMRLDSELDAQFVEAAARKYGYQYVGGQGQLGSEASEATAREARYRFLRETAHKYGANSVITAHHQDDYLETIILNILRGTSGRGLAPMRGYRDVVRPMLHMTRREIENYAKRNSVQWREDPTNADTDYLRNYIRMKIMPKIEDSRNEFLTISGAAGAAFDELDHAIALITPVKETMQRNVLLKYPFSVQKEIIRCWLIRHEVGELSRRDIERVTLATKTLPKNKKIDIKNGWLLESCKHYVKLKK